VFPALSSSTIHLFFGPCLKALSGTIRAPRVRESTTNTNNNSKTSRKKKKQNMDAIKTFQLAASSLKTLMFLTKSISKPVILREAVKHGKNFVEAFLKKAMPLLNKEFEINPTEVSLTLSELQKATRQLQTICAHGKDTHDSVVMAVIPSLRKSLETLIYSVKQMVIESKGRATFEIGNLNAKNLDGSIFKQTNIPKEKDC
jgi:hypothetical protein